MNGNGEGVYAARMVERYQLSLRITPPKLAQKIPRILRGM